MMANASEFGRAISPTREMQSYETLWSAPSVELKTIAELYRRHKALPSQLLEILKTENWFNEFERLERAVASYLDRVVTSMRFSVGVNGTFKYPDRLRHAKHPIELFYYRGDLGLIDSPCISVVGARKCSREGVARASRLSRELCEAGYTIVSGLASGVDTAAMTAAIGSGKGRTIGVIGTPLNKSYPQDNARLQEQIAQDYLLVSQVPFYRYEHEPFKTRRRYFPQRNETMAALSEATVIVEASETSGTLTQARACMQQGRKLFILNSCFESGLTWPFTYERRGAHRVRTTDDILKVLSSSNGEFEEQTLDEV